MPKFDLAQSTAEQSRAQLGRARHTKEQARILLTRPRGGLRFHPLSHAKHRFFKCSSADLTVLPL